jgi:hypothetical protein
MSTDKYALNLSVSFQTPNKPRISYDYLEPNLKRCAAVLASRLLLTGSAQKSA